MRSVELTPRLRALADLVCQGARLADVGTDHAYLPVWLLLQGRIDRAIAADLREGPLSRARETARQYGVEDRISFRLCDGLTAVGEDEADTISIAGMGGDTIAAILGAALWTRSKTLLLQPMTALPSLRQWLQSSAYRIVEERIAREGSRLYSVWTVTGGTMPPLTPAELWAGAQRASDPLRAAYLEMMAGKVKRALAGQLASRQRSEAQIQTLSEVLRGLEKMRKEL